LNNIAANEVNHAALIQKGLMKVLSKAFKGSDMDCKEYAAFTIANICSNPDYIAMIGKSGGIPPLIMLSRSENIHTLCLSLAAIRRLANSAENWDRLIKANVLDNLASAGQSAELEVQREVAACLCSLSLSEPHRIETCYKCIKAIVYLSMSQDPEVARQAVGALANLAEDVNTHEYIAVAGGGRCLISLEVHSSLVSCRHRFDTHTHVEHVTVPIAYPEFV